MKNIQTIGNEIHIIENFISEDTAKFISRSIDPYVVQAPDPSVFGGPSASDGADLIDPVNTIRDYSEDSNYNIAIDLMSMIAPLMSKTLTDFYKEDYVLKTIFYSKMVTGGKNTLHMDNNYIADETDSIEHRPGSTKDRSGLLYLDSNCEGGELFFPLQDFRIKPKPGTFIFFEGNEYTPHEVTEVKSGERHNIISFFWPKEKSTGGFIEKNLVNTVAEKQTTIEFMKKYHGIQND